MSFPVSLDRTLRWRQLPNLGDLPPPREAAAVGVFDVRGNKRLYQFGGQQDLTGFDTEGNFPLNTQYNDVFFYNLANGTWQQVTDAKPDPVTGTFPTPRTFMGYASWVNDPAVVPVHRPSQSLVTSVKGCGKGKTVVIVNNNNNDSVAPIIPAHPQWLLVYGGDQAQGTSENPRGIVLFGDLWAFDVENHQWLLLSGDGAPGTPGKRVTPGLAIVGDILYFFGGLSGTFQVQNDLWTFNLRTRGPWTQILATDPVRQPLPRYLHKWIYNREKGLIYLQNGDGAVAGNNNLLTDLWSFDPRTRIFSLIKDQGSYPATVQSAGAAFDNVFAFAFGEVRGGKHEGVVDVDGHPVLFESNPTNVTRFIDVRPQLRQEWTLLNPLTTPPDLKQVSFTQDGRTWYVLNGYNFLVVGEGNTAPARLVYNQSIWILDLAQLDALLDF